VAVSPEGVYLYIFFWNFTENGILIFIEDGKKKKKKKKKKSKKKITGN